MSRELWPILDDYTDNITFGNRFYAPVPIPTHDVRTHGLEAVVNHHSVGAHFGGFLAQLLLNIVAESGGMSWGIYDDFTEVVMGLSWFGAQDLHWCVSGCVNVYQNGQFENSAFFRHATCYALTV
jgi:hypothetical protein